MCCTDVRDEGDGSSLHLACVRRLKYVVVYLAEKANYMYDRSNVQTLLSKDNLSHRLCT